MLTGSGLKCNGNKLQLGKEILTNIRFSSGSTQQFPLKYRTNSGFLLILVGAVAFNTS